jgi:hypothetical protein
MRWTLARSTGCRASVQLFVEGIPAAHERFELAALEDLHRRRKKRWIYQV